MFFGRTNKSVVVDACQSLQQQQHAYMLSPIAIKRFIVPECYIFLNKAIFCTPTFISSVHYGTLQTQHCVCVKSVWLQYDDWGLCECNCVSVWRTLTIWS